MMARHAPSMFPCRSAIRAVGVSTDRPSLPVQTPSRFYRANGSRSNGSEQPWPETRTVLPIPFLGLFLAFLVWAPVGLAAQSRIVGGSKAGDADYPWMVAVAEKSSRTLFDRQFCGGTLIAADWVLTAAHCMEGEVPSGIEVVARISDLGDSSGAEIRAVRGIFIHPDFADLSGDLVNDIALILLDTPITSVSSLAYSRSASPSPLDDTVRAIGWGDTNSSPRFPNALQMVDLSLTPIAAARRIYGSNRLDHRHLAAMAPGKDTCGGDSGGPLFDLDGDQGAPLVLGITSFGLQCAERGVPGIYTNVGNYEAWINAFLAEPTTGDPLVEVSGRGIPVISRSLSASVTNGTHFGRRLRAGRTATRSFEISNSNGAIPLSINAARSSNQSFRLSGLPTYLLSGTRGSFSIQYRAPFFFRRGTSRGLVTIVTNDPVNPVFVFRVLARYR